MQEKKDLQQTVEIISVGTELILGNIVDTNARYLSEKLSAIGFQVVYHTVVGDDVVRLRQALQIALVRAKTIILTGGLGPTKDDMTKEVTAQVLQLPLVEDNHAWMNICDYFKKTGREISENNRKQALILQGAKPLYNDRGTAPGMICEQNGKTLVLLPGPPIEMQPMFEEQVCYYLQAKSENFYHSVYLEESGIGESRLETLLSDLIEQENPNVATYAKTGRVEIRVTGRGGSAAEAETRCIPTVKEIRRRVGDAIYSEAGESPEKVIVDLLAQHHQTLSTAESCTGGLIAKKITDVPGASAVFGQGYVTYSNAAKEQMLGVKAETLEKFDAVSAETATEMAQGAREKSGADLAISVTGLAGPDGGTPETPVGTVFIGLATAKQTYVEKLITGHEKERETIRELAVMRCLNLIRQAILKPEELQNGQSGEEVGMPPEISAVRPKKSFGRRLYERFIPLKKDSWQEILRKMIFLVAVPTFLVSCGILLSGYIQSLQAKSLLEDLKELYNPNAVIAQEEKEEIQYPEDYLDSFFELYKINRDIKAYVRIKGTPVDFPVVQTTDNDYYLRRNFKGQKNDYGVCFVDFRCDVKAPSDNLIFYAHNMKDTEMFGSLLNYKNVSYYKQHPVIEMNTVYRTGNYVVVGAFLSNAETKDGPVFGYHNKIDFSSDADFNNFMSEVAKRSWINTGIDVAYGDELLTLSTCSYEVSSGRFVVIARRLREGEEIKDVSMAVQKNVNEILMPKAYYEKNHLSIPKEYGGDSTSKNTSKAPANNSKSPSKPNTPSQGESSATSSPSGDTSQETPVSKPDVSERTSTSEENPSEEPSVTPEEPSEESSAVEEPSEESPSEEPSETPPEEPSPEEPSPEEPSPEESTEQENAIE